MPSAAESREVDLSQINSLLTEGSESTLNDAEMSSAPRPLFGEQPKAQYELKKERLRHRLIVTLLAQGMNHKEIAEQLGVTAVHVGYVAAQPWAREQGLAIIHEQCDETMRKLHEASLKAAETLVNVMETSENTETKRKAANDILDRKYGKPNQPYTRQEKPASEMPDDEIAKFLQAN